MSEPQAASLAVAPHHAATSWRPPEWHEARIALAQKTICPPNCSRSEFELFVEWCKRTGLDPFIKQAYLVERKARGEDGKLVSRFEPMAAEQGMGARVDAESDFLGIKGAAVYAGDEFAIDEVAQTIQHAWSPALRAKHGNKVIGAWAHARRRGRETPIAYVTFDSRVQTTFDKEKNAKRATQFWERDPAGMAAKCARAQAYRLAYPNLLSGVFIAEEVRDDEIDVTPRDSAPPAASKVEELRERVARRLGGTSPAQRDIGPVVSFGPAKGKAIAELSSAELEETILTGEAKLHEEPDAAWAPAVRAALDQLSAAKDRRVASGSAGNEP